MTTMAAWLALAVALVAVGYAWKLSAELATATRRLDRYNKALFDAGDEVRRLREQLVEEAAHLRADLRRLQGQSFSSEMTVREAQLLHPQTDQVMAGFHLGGCSHCAVEPDATLAQVCHEHGIPVDRLVANLNLLVEPSSGADAPGRALPSGPRLVKLPNVELEW
jgi:hypothetical protein